MAVSNQPPFPYYGAKAKLAPWILSHIPKHKNYVEPFCGSAAVLMAKEPSHCEVINDLSGDVVNFWRVLRDRQDELVSVLQLTPFARDEYYAARNVAEDVSSVERARRFFVRCNMAFNADTGSTVGFSGSVPNRTAKSTTFIRRVDKRLFRIAHRIRDVEIENIDALKLINRWRDTETVLYLDPPYLNSTRVTHRNYAVESGSDEFHSALIDSVADFPGTVLLSGYKGGLYERLGWRCEERSVAAHVSNTAGARRVECLWINRS